MKNIIIAIVVIVVIGILGVMVYNFMKTSPSSIPPGTAKVQQSQEQPSVQQLPQTIGMTSDAKLGNYLIAPSGMTLYVKKGENNSSTCYGQCAANWPPFMAMPNLVLQAGITGTLGMIPRTDGIQQVTYNGMPLYYYVGDKNTGDTTGDGFGGVWSVIKP